MENKYLPHTHMIRHLTATKLLRKKVLLSTISDILGHTDLQTTQVYLTTTDEDKCAAMKKLDDEEF